MFLFSCLHFPPKFHISIAHSLCPAFLRRRQVEREVRTERTAIRPAGAKPVRLSACRQKCHGARGVVHPDSTCRNQIGPTILINPCRHFSNSFLRWGSYICGSSAANGTCPHSAIWKLRHAQTTLVQSIHWELGLRKSNIENQTKLIHFN